MQKRILDVLEQKLAQALRDVDAAMQNQARATWADIGPTPNCPSVDSVMKAMHQVLAQGYQERARVAKEAVLSTLVPIRSKLTSTLAEKVMAAVVKAFPDDTFVTLATHTRGVYERRLAPAGKFSEHAFSLELALITVSAANNARQSVQSIQTALDEMLLQQAIANPVWWKRAPSTIWKFVTLPMMKWIFGIASAVLIAVILHALGIK